MIVGPSDRPIFLAWIGCLPVILIFASVPVWAAVKGCPQDVDIKPPPSLIELRQILAHHREWVDAYGLLDPLAWSGRKAEEVKKILADEKRADLAEANLRGQSLRGAVLIGADLSRADLSQADLSDADLSRAKLKCANLSKAMLIDASLFDSVLERADLNSALLRRADLSDANAARANLMNSDLSGAKIVHTTLARANLENADLEGASLSSSDLKYADVNRANLHGTIWELAVGSGPPPHSVARANNLDQVKFEDSGAALIDLREGLKKAGLREAERAVTFAIKRTERQKAWDDGVLGKIEATFSYIMFELPCAYGMYPGRPLLLLLVFLGLFSIPYAVALKSRGPDGIWRVWEKERVRLDMGGEPTKIYAVGLERALTAIQFSLVSAFRMGWKDLNVGNWISRVQPREYNLVGSGWVRAVSGAQSLLSVYLLALWALSYFARPFE